MQAEMVSPALQPAYCLLHHTNKSKGEGRRGINIKLGKVEKDRARFEPTIGFAQDYWHHMLNGNQYAAESSSFPTWIMRQMASILYRGHY